MLQFESVPPLSLRMPTLVRQSINLQTWDIDNLYPQRAESAIAHSYTLQSTVNSVAEFLAGEGFLDPEIGKLIVNDDESFGGETLNKLLDKVAKSASRYRAFALHIGYDLTYKMSSIRYIPIDYIRLPAPNSEGKIDSYLYCTNWELQPNKEVQGKPKVYEYPKYNPDPINVEEEIEMFGGIQNYPGQILFYTPDPYKYPIATFDPVLDHAQTQDELSQFKLAYTQNGMMATLAIVYPGEFESADEKKSFTDLIKTKKGAKNANKTIGVQDKSGTKKASDMFQSLQPVNMDRLFEFTEKSSVNAIIENEGWPKILIGVLPDSGMFNQQSMLDAYTYANAKTRKRRNNLAEFFSVLLLNWTDTINSTCTIKELQYVTVSGEQTNAAVPVPGAPAATPALPDATKDDKQDSPSINRHMQNLTAAQSQAIDRVVRKFKKGVYTRNMAKSILLGSGFNEEVSELWLNEAEEQMKLEANALKRMFNNIKAYLNGD